MARKDDLLFKARSQTGSLFVGRTADVHSYFFGVQGYFEWRNWAVAMTLCGPGDTIVEIGANVGTETVGYRDIIGDRGQLITFEPLPGNVECLERICAVNAWQNTKVMPCALGQESGKLYFVPPPDAVFTGMGHIASKQEEGNKGNIEVSCYTMDQVSDKLGAANLLVIDVEGSEHSVLKGGLNYLKSARPSILVEVHPAQLVREKTSSAEIYKFLQNLGYSVSVLSRYGLRTLSAKAMEKRTNWVCIPNERSSVVDRISAMVRKCAFLPCAKNVNPITKVSHQMPCPA